MVAKKDDAWGKRSYRRVVDYQQLNALTISVKYPIPTIADVLEMLHGAKVFTLTDMEQGFYQICVKAEAQFKTAFRLQLGQ